MNNSDDVRLIGGASHLPQGPVRTSNNPYSSHIKLGDNPCADCGTTENPIWFCDNVLWNEIMNDDKRGNEERGKIICPMCFIRRAEAKLDTSAWRLIPEFRWIRKGQGKD